MRAQNLPAASGWQWLSHGLAIYRRNPLLFALQVMSYWFIILLVNIVPLLGTLIAALINPFSPTDSPLACVLCSLGLMLAVALVVGCIESLSARLPMHWVTRYLLIASAATLFAMAVIGLGASGL